jgi:hypothetical protein
MKCIVLASALFVSAGDPGVGVEYVVSTVGDDSTVQHSTQIATALAQRHGMSTRALDSSCDLASYNRNLSGGPGPRMLDVCVDQEGQSVSFLLTEIIASDWSSTGDSLRRELEDTLRTRFGARVKRNP